MKVKLEPSSFMGQSFVLGGIAALEGFLTEIVNHRGRIENQEEPVFDVIVGLLMSAATAMDELQP